MKHKSILLGAVLAAVMLLSISGLAFVANAADTLPNSKNGDVGEQTCLAPGGKTDSQLEFWKVDEFESWMEQQHEKISGLLIVTTSLSTAKVQMAIIIAGNGHRLM